MKKVLTFLLAILMVAAMFTGCNAKEDTADNSEKTPPNNDSEVQKDNLDETPDNSDERFTIGLSMPNIDFSIFQAEVVAVENACKELDINLLSVVADSDPAKQKSQIEDLITKGVGAIIINPHDADAICSSLKDCHDAGIYTILMGRLPSDTTYMDTCIYCDNYEAARVDAEEMVKVADDLGYEKIKCIELIGSLADQNAVERTEAFNEYAKELGIEVVAQVSTEWDLDIAYNRLVDTMTIVDEYNAFFVPADNFIVPIKSVLQDAGRWVKYGEEGFCIITSIDGAAGGLEFILDGYVCCTANTDGFEFGKLSVEAAVALLEGKQPEGINADKKVFVPSVPLEAEDIAAAGDTIWGNVFK